jgi:hypothetical protein
MKDKEVAMQHPSAEAPWLNSLSSYAALCPPRLKKHSYAVNMLFENSSSASACQLPERFLQALWNEQYFTAPLRTSAGETVQVESPGTWNLEPGPDFKNAVLAVGGVRLCGDVEIHRDARDWEMHGHGLDPRYERVILHAVWNDPLTPCPPALPCLVMKHAVGGHWQQLSQQLGADNYPYARQVGPGLCAVNWSALSNDQLRNVLQIAGLARFYEKAAGLQAQVIAKGFDQTAYEAVFRALGYKVHQDNMHKLAGAVPLELLRRFPDAADRAAILFGVSGLLPDPTRRRCGEAQRQRVAQMWDRWWAAGQAQLDLVWSRSGMRPYNSPERRLAAGCALLEKWQLRPGRAVVDCAVQAQTAKELLHALTDLLKCRSSWEEMKTLEGKLKRPAALLGPRRAADILVNVLLPLLCAYSTQRRDAGMEQRVRDAYLSAAPLQSNRAIEEAHRLLVPPSRARAVVRTACEQQGMLGLYRDFCQSLYGNCRNCPLAAANAFEKLLPGQ